MIAAAEIRPGQGCATDAARRVDAAVAAGGGGACELVVLIAGNPARGDDALGPLLAERLVALAIPGLRLVCD